MGHLLASMFKAFPDEFEKLDVFSTVYLNKVRQLAEGAAQACQAANLSTRFSFDVIQ